MAPRSDVEFAQDIKPQAGRLAAETARAAWRRPAVTRIEIRRTLLASNTGGDLTGQTGGAG